ncbi:MAG TPA: hypothetical protein PLY93_15290, partial [Turneriella sp.]|nr:hypothetical protein [Turneriella sp.]
MNLRRWVWIIFFSPLTLSHCLAFDRKLSPETCAPQRHKTDEIVVSYSLPQEAHRILGEITVQY